MAEQLRFPGFPEKPEENYWQYPKVMNGYWHQLTGTEQKVLDYILRHTWGYQKTVDRISLSQFKNGIIIKKIGERIDWGIGIKRNEDILKAIKRLEELGFIKTFQQKGKTKEFSLVRQVNNPCPTGEQVGCPTGEHTINNYTINNRQYVSKETEKSPPSYGNKDNKEGEQGKALQPSIKKEINSLIDLFQEVNPSYERLFENKTQRASLERLVKKFGQEKVSNMIKGLKEIFGKPYAPSITTPYLLELKLADYINYLKKRSATKIDFIDFTKL